ncbi:hypothetical protein SAMD00019534_109000 [Acytostelium subglobosum LB1]|uniref:hypothetical protein n=1 Tax=Acytostelium subglobosum LB1 TaxID=1410327 RepID=UPI000645013B|nr:hypothetical protein SAMD00019534_109000 [Acytostelium subglobosum LB1]GAM27724.1 hypothetical protein SAMD00019534_109000 [Acytostelium subglobosum LB1]|eukprot:XP_012749383.1 hypothetical protein SAMD00019534_109000 [Acytostelium subglobosum LB1]
MSMETSQAGAPASFAQHKGIHVLLNSSYSPIFQSTQQHSPVSVPPPISTELPPYSLNPSTLDTIHPNTASIATTMNPPTMPFPTGGLHHHPLLHQSYPPHMTQQHLHQQQQHLHQQQQQQLQQQQQQQHVLQQQQQQQQPQIFCPPIPPYPKANNSFMMDNKMFTNSIPTPLAPPMSSLPGQSHVHPSHQSQQQQQQPPPPSTNNYHRQLHQHLENHLNQFWKKETKDISMMDDFKTTHELPLARIKKIMKSDDEVNKISAEVPMLFSKACELFILEMTIRSWVHTEMNKRRTLQRIDIANALTKSEMFDFLIDIVPREELRSNRKFYDDVHKENFVTPEYLQFIQLQQAEAHNGFKRSYSIDITPSDDSPSYSPKKRSMSHDFTLVGENPHQYPDVRVSQLPQMQQLSTPFGMPAPRLGSGPGTPGGPGGVYMPAATTSMAPPQGVPPYHQGSSGSSGAAQPPLNIGTHNHQFHQYYYGTK